MYIIYIYIYIYTCISAWCFYFTTVVWTESPYREISGSYLSCFAFFNHTEYCKAFTKTTVNFQSFQNHEDFMMRRLIGYWNELHAFNIKHILKCRITASDRPVFQTSDSPDQENSISYATCVSIQWNIYKEAMKVHVCSNGLYIIKYQTTSYNHTTIKIKWMNWWRDLSLENHKFPVASIYRAHALLFWWSENHFLSLLSNCKCNILLTHNSFLHFAWPSGPIDTMDKFIGSHCIILCFSTNCVHHNTAFCNICQTPYIKNGSLCKVVI